jgi:osmoprotectant transport system ATP-binding protein
METEGLVPDAAGIEIENVAKRYGEVLALDVESLVVAPRTTLALIGPSGCGKSTLLRLVVGLLRPDRGRVSIGGTPMGPTTRRALQLRMGYVIQEGGLFPHLSAGENVALVARDLGWAEARIRARTEELLELSQIPRELVGRFPTQLSGGQRQRIALMRADAGPEVLLLDEPLTALDPMIRSDVQRDLKSVFAGLKKRVVFVTQDMAEAAFIAGEMAIMRTGRILQRGSFQDLARHPADPFVTEFIRAQRPLDLAEAKAT